MTASVTASVLHDRIIIFWKDKDSEHTLANQCSIKAICRSVLNNKLIKREREREREREGGRGGEGEGEGERGGEGEGEGGREREGGREGGEGYDQVMLCGFRYRPCEPTRKIAYTDSFFPTTKLAKNLL